MDVLVTEHATDNGLVTEVLVSHVSKLGTRRIWWYYDLIAMKRSVCGREHGALDAVLFEDNAAWVRKHRSPLATQAHGMSATAA